MHQILSYQTAVRANSANEYRELISKRSCVTLTLTTAFFTLISGYLLGTFVCERKYHIRSLTAQQNHFPLNNDDGTRSIDMEKNTIQVTSEDYRRLQEMHAYQLAKDKILKAARELNQLFEHDDNYRSTSLNTQIFNKYISCTQDVPPNTNIESNQFIEQLLDNTLARQRDCLRIIQFIIDNNLMND